MRKCAIINVNREDSAEKKANGNMIGITGTLNMAERPNYVTNLLKLCGLFSSATARATEMAHIHLAHKSRLWPSVQWDDEEELPPFVRSARKGYEWQKKRQNTIMLWAHYRYRVEHTKRTKRVAIGNPFPVVHFMCAHTERQYIAVIPINCIRQFSSKLNVSICGFALSKWNTVYLNDAEMDTEYTEAGELEAKEWKGGRINGRNHDYRHHRCAMCRIAAIWRETKLCVSDKMDGIELSS